MPFIQRTIPAVNDLVEFDAPDDYPQQKLLDFAAQRTMVGLLEQVRIFSAHAADIFTDILEEANETFKRVQDLSGRVAQLSERIPEVEEFYKVTPVKKPISRLSICEDEPPTAASASLPTKRPTMTASTVL